MKNAIVRTVLLLFTIILLLASVADHHFFHGPIPAGEAKRIVIPRGAGFHAVADLLKSEGILKGTRWFYLMGRVMRVDRSVRAGTYLIVPGTPPGRVLNTLRKGGNEVVRVTIPEGLWVVETARILSETLGLPEEEIIRMAHDREFVSRLGLPGPTLEGYLFPETYLFFRDESVERALRILTDRFQAVFGVEEMGRAAELGLSPREAVTLASIIEAEAVLDEERARISAVYHNRLEIGWRLQADPTVQFALGTRRRLLLRDLEFDSPYNTYRCDGIPPGPICSPGAASIQAALYPLEGSRELFFVATREGGGRHAFSTTQGAHNRARAAAQRNRRNSP